MAKLSDVIASNRDTFNVLVYFSVLMFGLSLGSFFLISRTAVGGEHAWDAGRRGHSGRRDGRASLDAGPWATGALRSTVASATLPALLSAP